jgi:hypothetical protein
MDHGVDAIGRSHETLDVVRAFDEARVCGPYFSPRRSHSW